jgi:hypothetical protein
MSNIIVTVQGAQAPLPAGSTLPSDTTTGDVNLAVTDSAGVVQTAHLVGTETPPYSAPFTIANEGAGSVTATAIDSSGKAIAPVITQTFNTTGTGTGGTFFTPSAITVTAAPAATSASVRRAA